MMYAAVVKKSLMIRIVSTEYRRLTDRRNCDSIIIVRAVRSISRGNNNIERDCSQRGLRHEQLTTNGRLESSTFVEMFPVARKPV